MRVAALVLAAGRGQRLGAGGPKALLPLRGVPLWVHSVEALARCSAIEWILPIVPEDARDRFAAEDVGAEARAKLLPPVPGGAERHDSMRAGLEALPVQAEGVAVHDAARPLVDPADVDRVIEAAEASGAALLAVPASDTIKRVRDGRVVETPAREECFAAQTPQVFRVEVLRAAIERAAAANDRAVTDDVEWVERAGGRVDIVLGQQNNLKITYPGDVAVAERWMDGGGSEVEQPRIGQGIDAHQLVAGRPLRLSGVEIPHDRGLEGHSDGDVVLHAVTSALLGALGEGDLGTHFPSSDPSLKGVDSADLLRRGVTLMRERGLVVGNVDATVIAQAPRLAPHRAAMEARLAELLDTPPDRVNLKVTSTDRLGALGREEGIAAQAVLLLRGSA